jgi:8-amino-7-oxononanoate synthase
MYIDIEERLTELLVADDTLVLPTITHIHMSVIPAIAGRGDIFLDAAAPYLYSGPSPVASLATVLAGFDVNDSRGDDIRAVDAGIHSWWS